MTGLPPATHGDPSRLIDTFARRVPNADHVIVLSTGGAVIAASADLPGVDADHLATLAAGLHRLARLAGRHFGDADVRRTVVELVSGWLLVAPIDDDTCLAVACDEDADVGLVTCEMQMAVTLVRPLAPVMASATATSE